MNLLRRYLLWIHLIGHRISQDNVHENLYFVDGGMLQDSKGLWPWDHSRPMKQNLPRCPAHTMCGTISLNNARLRSKLRYMVLESLDTIIKYYNNISKMYNPKQVLIGRLLEMVALVISARLVHGGPDKQQGVEK